MDICWFRFKLSVVVKRAIAGVSCAAWTSRGRVVLKTRRSTFLFSLVPFRLKATSFHFLPYVELTFFPHVVHKERRGRKKKVK